MFGFFDVLCFACYNGSKDSFGGIDMLYPITNDKRLTISLNGLWKFKFVDQHYVPDRPLKDFRLMAVPGSYNDLMTTLEERDYVGSVCYEHEITVPKRNGIWHLRVGAAPHHAKVYINGKLLSEHEGGYLPIDIALPDGINQFRISIILDNRLTLDSFPMGEIIQKDGKEIQSINFDFYNYIGLHRNVFIYQIPHQHIRDIIVKSDLKDQQGLLSYEILTDDDILSITLIDPQGKKVGKLKNKKDVFIIKKPFLWDIGKGNLYTLDVKTAHDHYTLTCGIRKVEIIDHKLFLNHREIYLRGFGMHEDHITIGKGSLSSHNLKDFELLKWIHANSFRTSHYPYDEEMYDLADQYGILVINEIPAVGLNFWSPRAVFNDQTVGKQSLEYYKNMFDELIARDQNHPSIIMYSLANEANTHEENAVSYFTEIVHHARTKTDLPLMIVEYVSAEQNKVAQLFDVVGLNRYMAWYSDFGDLSVIEKDLTKAIQDYLIKFSKPVVITEFGADTIAGFHSLPSLAFSEEYQDDFITKYLDTIEKIDGVIGTHLWNFADFQTKQGLTRIIGNKKGVFTRDRQPKMVAHTLKKRWEIKK
jgi:beta-glucuronidase